MKTKSKYLIIGVVIGVLFTSLTPAIAENITVAFNSIGIKINGIQVAKIGETYTLPNGKDIPFSISYADTTYLPVRKIGELFSIPVNYDDQTQTVLLGKVIPIEQQTPAMTYDEFKSIWTMTKERKIDDLTTVINLTYNGDLNDVDFVKFWTDFDADLLTEYGVKWLKELYPSYSISGLCADYYYNDINVASGSYHSKREKYSFCNKNPHFMNMLNPIIVNQTSLLY